MDKPRPTESEMLHRICERIIEDLRAQPRRRKRATAPATPMAMRRMGIR
jgi:hypothetical protein